MLTDDHNISLLKNYSQETKKLLVEAKKLKNVFIQNSSSCLTQEILKLQEKEIRLAEHQNEANTILASIFNALEDIRVFINHLQKNEKIGVNYKPVDLSERKIMRLVDRLKTLKVQVENQNKSPESSLGEKTIKLLETLKAKVYENRSIDSEHNHVGRFQERIRKQQKLDELRLKKIQGESRFKRLTEDLKNGRDFLQLLEEEIKVSEKRLADRTKFEEKRGSNMNNNGLDAMIKELDEKRFGDYNADLLPKEKKISELMTLLEGATTSKSIEQKELRRKFHFVFVVNRNETMNAGRLKEAENCINAVIEDRKGEKDLHSLILYDHTVQIVTCQQEMKDSVKLPEKFGKNDKHSLKNVLAEVSKLLQHSPYQEYAPIVILLADGKEEKGVLMFKSTENIGEKSIERACESVSQMYTSFGPFGFHFFILGISPYYQEGLKRIATSGNGGKTLLKGPSENHDFLNNCKFHRILPNVFRDLTNSSANKLLNDPQARIKAIKDHIENLKDSISLRKRFIDENYEKQKIELQKRADIMSNTSKHESNTVRKSYEESLRSLQEERDEWKAKIHAFEEEEKSLTTALSLDYDINFLEEAIEQERRKDKEDYQNKTKDELMVINPDKINISKSIEAFEKLWSMLGCKSNSLVLVLQSLLIKTSQVVSRLKKQTSPIYSSLVEHYKSSLGAEARCTDEAVMMVKIAKTRLGVIFDERILNCLSKLISPRVLCDLDEDMSFLEQKIKEKASILYTTAESKMKMNEKNMDDLLSRIDIEHDNAKKIALREEKEVLRKRRLDIQAELEVMEKEGVDVFQEKLIMCFRELRRKLSETKENLPSNEKPMLDRTVITQCMEIQRLIKMLSEVEYSF